MKTHLEELLSGYVDEQLTSDERARVEKHLADCAACRAELDVLRELKATLSEVKMSHTMDMSPEFFWSQVRRSIVEEEKREAKESPSFGGMWGMLLWQRLAFAGIAALIVVGIGITLFQGIPPQVPTEVAAFAEVDSASTTVQGGEVQLANLGGHAMIVMPDWYVEVDEVHSNLPNVSVFPSESPSGDAVIWIQGLKDEGEEPRGM